MLSLNADSSNSKFSIGRLIYDDPNVRVTDAFKLRGVEEVIGKLITQITCVCKMKTALPFTLNSSPGFTRKWLVPVSLYSAPNISTPRKRT